MTLWSRISAAISALAQGESLSQVFEHLRTPPERSVAFTIAVIALGAKMAKADGVVKRAEVTAFREVFQIAPEDEAQAARVFNLARQDVAGYEDYARRISAMFHETDAPLCELLEGLFHIAVADGSYHPAEDQFLRNVSKIFGLDERQFLAFRARMVPDAPRDPYTVLGVSPDMDLAEIRKHWRQAVRDSHPDQMIARGVPQEAIRISEKRLIDINTAWEKIQASHKEPA
ncbi:MULTISPECIES: TerB family tellurite resistance protein [unclassified Marinovum]